MRTFRITIYLNENVLVSQECEVPTLHDAKRVASRLCLEQQQLTLDLRGGYQSNWEDTGDHGAQKTWDNHAMVCQIHIAEKEG